MRQSFSPRFATALLVADEEKLVAVLLAAVLAVEHGRLFRRSATFIFVIEGAGLVLVRLAVLVASHHGVRAEGHFNLNLSWATASSM